MGHEMLTFEMQELYDRRRYNVQFLATRYLIKKEKKLKKCVFILLFLCCAKVHALEWHTSKINMVYPQENGDFTLRLKEGTANCENGSKFYKVVVGKLGVTDEGRNALLSSALAAAAQSQDVDIYWEPQDGQCYIQRFKVNY